MTRLVTTLLTAAITQTAFASVVGAQPRVEITGFSGYRIGSVQEFQTGIVCLSITTPCPSVATGDDGIVVGAVVDVAVTARLAVEVLVNHQTTRLRFITIPGQSDTFDEDVRLTMVHGGLAYRWHTQPVTPFLSAGLGLGRLALGTTILDIGETSLSGSAAGGVLVWMRERLAIRLEARHAWMGVSGERGGRFRTLDITAGVVAAW